MGRVLGLPPLSGAQPRLHIRVLRHFAYTCFVLSQKISLHMVGMTRNSLICHTWLMVKNLPAVQETRLQFLGWEDPLEKGMANHSSILGLKNYMDKGAWRVTTVHGVSKSR